MFRGSVFPTGYYGTNGGCMVETSGSVGSGNDGTVPALVSVNGGTTVFVGDNHGAVHKVGLTFTTRSNIGQNQPSYSLDENAAFDTGQSIKSTVAVGTVHDTPGLFVSNGTGKVRALDTMNNGLWETAPMSQTQGLRATPVTNGTSAYQHDQSGRLQQISTTDGTFSWQQEVSGPSRSSAANASPVVAKDGSVFVTGGPVALGYSATGVTQWSFDARSLPESPGTLLVDAVSPVLSCDGTLYVVATDADHALVHAIITDSTGGIAAAGWPAGQHDSRNTANANAALVGGDGMCAD